MCLLACELFFLCVLPSDLHSDSALWRRGAKVASPQRFSSFHLYTMFMLFVIVVYVVSKENVNYPLCSNLLLLVFRLSYPYVVVTVVLLSAISCLYVTSFFWIALDCFFLSRRSIGNCLSISVVQVRPAYTLYFLDPALQCYTGYVVVSSLFFVLQELFLTPNFSFLPSLTCFYSERNVAPKSLLSFSNSIPSWTRLYRTKQMEFCSIQPSIFLKYQWLKVDPVNL